MIASRFRVLLWLTAGWFSLPAVEAQVLFDGAQGTLPQQQGWDYLALPGNAQLESTGTAARLDTDVTLSEQAGFATLAPATLDRTSGFAVEFVARLFSESHRNPDRAGFSVIVLDREARGIELGFWSDQVFAQAQEPLFTHAEDAPLDWGETPRTFALGFSPTHYALFVDRTLLLRGPLRDYSAFAGILDVYETPNFVFLGDDTTSASAIVELSRVALVRPVQLEGKTAGSIVWVGVPGTTYRVESTGTLDAWTEAGLATSPSSTFQFARPLANRFGAVRVRYP